MRRSTRNEGPGFLLVKDWRRVAGFGLGLGLAMAGGPAAGGASYATPYSFTTIAGNAGYGVADGVGSAAAFNTPQGVAADGAGGFFLTDSHNCTVRRVTPVLAAGVTNWAVTTLAGLAASAGAADGTGSGARFNRPNGIAVGLGGCLFVADNANHTVRQLTPTVSGGATNWVVTTIAGQAGNAGGADGTGPAAQFNHPEGLVADAQGNLLLADNGNHAIRRLTPVLAGGQTNWAVDTVAGLLGTAGTADGAGSAARFANPFGITLDRAGLCYVSDYGAGTIRQLFPPAVQTNWTVKTIAGKAGQFGSADGTNDAAQFYNPFGMTADASGVLYVVDGAEDTVRKLTPSVADGITNWVVTTLAGSAGNAGSDDGLGAAALFHYPNGVAVNADGLLCVADSFNNTLRSVTPAGLVSTIAGLAGGPGSADGIGPAAQFFNPFGIAADTNGTLYVADSVNNTIRRIVPTLSAGTTNWTTTTLAGQAQISGSDDGTGDAALFSNPLGLALDPAGNLFVADNANNTIRMLARAVSAGQTVWVVTTIAGSAVLSGSADGTGSQARFLGPTAVAADAAGNLYVADSGNATLRRLARATNGATNWVVTTLAGTAGATGTADGVGAAAQFNNPEGLAVDAAGNLYVADTANHTLRKVSPTVSGGQTNWVVTTIAGTAGTPGSTDGPGSAALFNVPAGLTVDPAGNLYVADYANDLVRKVRPPAPGTTNWTVTTLGGLTRVEGSADGLGAAARFGLPAGLALDAAGNLYVTDSDNSTVRRGWSPPYMVLSPPANAGDQVQIGFSLLSGSASSFLLLDSTLPAGPWATSNISAFVTDSPGVSYTFTVAAPAAPVLFYRVQCP